MKDITIREYVVCDGKAVSHVDITPPIEVHSGDVVRVKVVPGAAILDVQWFRGWASGRRIVSAPMPDPACLKDFVMFMAAPLKS